jgi:hypothetical protein
MYATIELFRNLPLASDVGAIHQMVLDRAGPLRELPGLASKVWFNDPERQEFGAFLLWHDRNARALFQGRESAEQIGARWGVVPEIRNFDVYQRLQNSSVDTWPPS